MQADLAVPAHADHGEVLLALEEVLQGFGHDLLVVDQHNFDWLSHGIPFSICDSPDAPAVRTHEPEFGRGLSGMHCAT
jgi:hypothetical protein